MKKRLIKLNVTNCFLFEAPHGFVLIDTGYEYEWERFCEQLQAAGVRLDAISHLILTHHHDDHAGLVGKIVEQHPAIRIVMSYQARDLIAQGRNTHPQGGWYTNRRIAVIFPLLMAVRGLLDPHKAWTHRFPAYHARANDILVSGEPHLHELGIDLPGKILATPGHSPDSISILFDDGDCIVGDAAANVFQFAGAKYCVVSIDDYDEYYANWRTIIAANARQIFPAHGQPFPVAKLVENLGKNRKRDMIVIKRYLQTTATNEDGGTR